MQAFLFLFFFVRWAPIGRPSSQTFPAETVETGDKNRDDFHCIQMRLVMSMRLIFGHDFGNNVIFPDLRPLIFV